MDAAVEKGAGGDHHGPGANGLAQGGAHPYHFLAAEFEAVHHRLPDDEVGLAFEHRLHPQAIAQPVRLGAGGPDRRALARVEPAELDGRGVDVFGHLAPQGVDLAHEMALGQSPYRWIARHGADGIGVHHARQGAATKTGRGQGRLATGVTGADHHHVVGRCVTGHGISLTYA